MIEINVAAKKVSPWGNSLTSVDALKGALYAGVLLQLTDKLDGVTSHLNPTWSKLDDDANLQKYLDKYIIQPHSSHTVVVYHGIIVKGHGGNKNYFVMIAKRTKAQVQAVIDLYKNDGRLVEGFPMHSPTWRVLSHEGVYLS